MSSFIDKLNLIDLKSSNKKINYVITYFRKYKTESTYKKKNYIDDLNKLNFLEIKMKDSINKINNNILFYFQNNLTDNNNSKTNTPENNNSDTSDDSKTNNSNTSDNTSNNNSDNDFENENSGNNNSNDDFENENSENNNSEIDINSDDDFCIYNYKFNINNLVKSIENNENISITKPKKVKSNDIKPNNIKSKKIKLKKVKPKKVKPKREINNKDNQIINVTAQTNIKRFGEYDDTVAKKIILEYFNETQKKYFNDFNSLQESINKYKIIKKSKLLTFENIDENLINKLMNTVNVNGWKFKFNK